MQSPPSRGVNGRADASADSGACGRRARQPTEPGVCRGCSSLKALRMPRWTSTPTPVLITASPVAPRSPNLDIHRVGCDKEERPTHGGGEKGHGSSLPHREAYALSPRQSAAESRESRQLRASPSGADEEGGGWRWNRAKSKWPGQVGRWRGRRRRSRGVHGSSDLGRCTERQANSMRARDRPLPRWPAKSPSSGLSTLLSYGERMVAPERETFPERRDVSFERGAPGWGEPG